MDSQVHCLSDCQQDACETPSGIQVVDVFDTQSVYHLVHYFVHAFHDSIGLWIASGNQLLAEPVLVFDCLRDFSSELASSIHDDFGWPWILSKPMKLKVVGYIVCPLGVNFTDLKPSGCRINHCPTV